MLGAHGGMEAQRPRAGNNVLENKGRAKGGPARVMQAGDADLEQASLRDDRVLVFVALRELRAEGPGSVCGAEQESTWRLLNKSDFLGASQSRLYLAMTTKQHRGPHRGIGGGETMG